MWSVFPCPHLQPHTRALTLLCAAISQAVVHALRAAGASMNEVDAKNEPPLVHAIAKRTRGLIETMIRGGAYVERVDEQQVRQSRVGCDCV